MNVPRRHRLYCVGFAVALAGATPKTGRADVPAAARAFAQGQAAQLEGNYAQAAERFELAYSLQPSKEALRSAARMHMSARNFARAATHARTLLARFADDAPSAELARTILDEVAPALVEYEVTCSLDCALSVDRLAYFVDPARRHSLYLNPGRVTLEAHFSDGRTASRSVTNAAGERAVVELDAPAKAPPASPARVSPGRGSPRGGASVAAPSGDGRSGLPPVVPWLTGAAAVACGGLTLWAALDTRRMHDEYVAHPTPAKWDEGVARQRMTNVLAASTAVLGVATVTLAFFVRDSSKPKLEVRPALGARAASVTVAGNF